MSQKCIICGNKKFKHVLKIHNAATSVSKLLDKNDLQKDKKIILELIACTNCGLAQLKNSNFVKSKPRVFKI